MATTINDTDASDLFAEEPIGEGNIVTRQLSAPAIFIGRFVRQPLALLGAFVLFSIIALAIFEPSHVPKVPFTSFNLSLGFAVYAPSFNNFPAQIFGYTSPAIRPGSHSVLLDVLYGARVSLTVGFLAALIAGTIGTVLGAISGYMGGWVDNMLMRLTDLMLALPFLPLLIGIILASGHHPTVPMMIAIFGLAGWPTLARIVRANFLILRQQDFAEAARAVGVSPMRLIFRHLLPHTLPLVVVTVIQSVTVFILAEATLEFVGLGPLTDLTWGGIIQTSSGFTDSLWWWPAFPGLTLLVTVLALNMVGEGVREALAVHTRNR